MEEVLSLDAVVERRSPILSESDLEPRYPITADTRFPIEERVPVTKEYMAAFVGSGASPSNEMEAQFLEEVHSSVSAMVHGLAFKYVSSCQWGDTKDMVQDCWVRIVEKLHLYQPTRSKFTTWTYHVCSSVLNRYYRKNRRYRERYVEMEDGMQDGEVSKEGAERVEQSSDVRQAVRELLEEHPEESRIIVALLGNPDSEQLSADVDVGRAAIICGVERKKVSSVYDKVIRPFFAKRFRRN